VIEEVRKELLRVCRDAEVRWWKSRAARNRPIPSGEKCSGAMSLSSSCRTSWLSHHRADARGLLHGAWRDSCRFPVIAGRFKDYILREGDAISRCYTGVTLRHPRNQKIELQIRTPEMQIIAENGVAAHWL